MTVFSTIAELHFCIKRFLFVISLELCPPLTIVYDSRYTFVCFADIPNNSGLNKADFYSPHVTRWM